MSGVTGFDYRTMSLSDDAVRVRYLLVDRRLSAARPLVGVYFEDGEPDTQPPGAPVPAGWLDKFDAVAGASRVYDNGDVRIYDLGALLG